MKTITNSKFTMSFCLMTSLALLVGCNNSRPATAMVAGVVEYKGKKITSGIVHFYEPSKGVGVMCPIDQSGRYQTPEKILSGEYKVEIRPEEAPPPAPGSNEMPAPPVVKGLPKKYTSMATSGISKTLVDGENQFNITLP